jgi:hypothetical protein
MLSEMILGSVAMTHQVGNMKLHLLGKDTVLSSHERHFDNPIIRFSVNLERINSLADWCKVQNTRDLTLMIFIGPLPAQQLHFFYSATLVFKFN